MSSINIAANRDLYFNQGQGTYNYGGGTLCYVGNASSGNAYLSLFGFPAHGIPSTAIVTDAVFKVHRTTLGGIGFPLNGLTLRVCAVATNWTENTLNGTAGQTNYNGRPSRTEGAGQYTDIAFGASNAQMGTNTWINFPINSLMQYMVNGGTTYDYGFYFYASTAAASTSKAFAQRELDSGARAARLVVTYNDPPTSPTINFPVAGSKTYNQTPRIGITSGTDSDGDTQLPWANIGTPYANSTTNQTWWSYPSMTNNTKRLLKWGITQSYFTSPIINVRSFDAALNSAMVTRNFDIIQFVPGETITAGATTIKNSHITELRTCINNISAYYGITNRTWTDSTLTGISPKTCHIQEMRLQISEIITRVKEFDTSSSNGIIPHSNGGFKCVYSASSGSQYAFFDLSSVTDYTVQSGDYLQYDIYYDSSTLLYSAMDLGIANGQYLSQTAAQDQNALSANATTALNQALKAWYRRKIALPAGWVGSSITLYDMGAITTGAVAGNTYFRNMNITDVNDSIRKTIFVTTNGTATWVLDDASAGVTGSISFFKVPYGDYTDATIINGTTTLKAVHINELRNLIPTL